MCFEAAAAVIAAAVAVAAVHSVVMISASKTVNLGGKQLGFSLLGGARENTGKKKHVSCTLTAHTQAWNALRTKSVNKKRRLFNFIYLMLDILASWVLIQLRPFSNVMDSDTRIKSNWQYI